MWGIVFLTVMGVQVVSAFQIEAPDNKFFNFTDKQILDNLLDKSRYDKRMRPTDYTVVNVSILLLSLASPDESSLKYEVEFLLHQIWFDPRLKFDDAGKHRYLNGLLHTEHIWLPDIYFIKHGEFKSPLIPVHIILRIFPNGFVIYSVRRNMALNCQGNLRIFPFDNLKCPFAIESVSHAMTEVELQWSESFPAITTATSLRQHNAYLIKYEAGTCDMQHTWRGDYSCLRVLLVFTRDKSFYISTVFVPGVVLVTSSFISFWLDISDVPSRVTIGVTTMLTFCTTTNGFRSTLPVVSNLKAMNLWDGVCMFFIFASMLEVIIVDYLHRKHPTTPSNPASVSDAIKNPSLTQIDTNVQSSTAPSAATPTEQLQQRLSNSSLNYGLQRDKATAAVSGFICLWCSQQFAAPDNRNRQRLAVLINNVSKGVFPLLFGVFTVGFFLTFAVIKPSQPDNFTLL